jgi:hypothetical protein
MAVKIGNIGIGAVYIGAQSIGKIYIGSTLVFGGFVPPTPSPAIVQQVYDDFEVVLQAYQKPNNNVYTDFNIGLQAITKV